MEKKGERVIISTVYGGKAVKTAITKLSPNKIILLIDKPIEKTKKTSVEYLKKHFGEIIKIETLATSIYEISKIVKDVVKKIDKEAKKDNEIIIHITEGRKLTSLALLFAAYMRKDKIKGAYYITEEENKIISLPLIDFAFRNTKKKMLQEIEKGNSEIEKLMKKLNINKSATYQHINELKKEGYIQNGKDKKLELTELGRIVNS